MCELGPALELFEPVQFEENNLGENMAIFFFLSHHLALPFLALTLQNKKVLKCAAAASIFAPSTSSASHGETRKKEIWRWVFLDDLRGFTIHVYLRESFPPSITIHVHYYIKYAAVLLV